MAPHKLDADTITKQFPALVKKPDFTYGDNAGGSQILQSSIDCITDYLINTNIQMGSDYAPLSTQRCLSDAQASAVELFGAESTNEIVFGASSTQNLDNLALSIEDGIKEGDEIIVSGEHEANGGPWKKMARRRNAVVKEWKFALQNPENPFSLESRLEDLLPLITAKTRLVAFTACSNILGSVTPIKEIAQAIRSESASKGAKDVLISLDCVAYAPHKRMNVKDWDIDFCIFSYYKVFGPHVSGMYIREATLKSHVKPITHHFLSPVIDGKGYKLQPHGPGYEITWGTAAVVPYLKSLTPDGTVDAAYEAIAAHDVELARLLLEYLTADKQWKRGVRVVGSEKPGPNRMPTISFVVMEGSEGEKAWGSKAFVNEFDKRGTAGLRFGHFYAYTLVSSVVKDASDGIIRYSLVHYSTAKDVEKFISICNEILY